MKDLDSLFQRLGLSRFRSQFRLNQKDRAYLQAKGLEKVMVHAEEFLATRIAPAEPKNDGKQTPWHGHPVFVAQHATACCCRSCIEKWHGIAQHKPLRAEEIAYLLRVLRKWLQDAA